MLERACGHQADFDCIILPVGTRERVKGVEWSSGCIRSRYPTSGESVPLNNRPTLWASLEASLCLVHCPLRRVWTLYRLCGVGIVPSTGTGGGEEIRSIRFCKDSQLRTTVETHSEMFESSYKDKLCHTDISRVTSNIRLTSLKLAILSTD